VRFLMMETLSQADEYLSPEIEACLNNAGEGGAEVPCQPARARTPALTLCREMNADRGCPWRKHQRALSNRRQGRKSNTEVHCSRLCTSRSTAAAPTASSRAGCLEPAAQNGKFGRRRTAPGAAAAAAFCRGCPRGRRGKGSTPAREPRALSAGRPSQTV